jgi:hypothetical protein
MDIMDLLDRVSKLIRCFQIAFSAPLFPLLGIANITIGALTAFRPTGITDIISTAAGTAGIVTNIACE